MIVTCTYCGQTFQSKEAPCPEGREGCCVAHSDSESFKCTCGYNMGPTIGQNFLEGRVFFDEGVSIININAIRKLELI